MKLTFRNQMIITCVIVAIFNLLNVLIKNWIFTTIGFVSFGLFWAIHPVLPQNAIQNNKAKWAIRIAGMVVIVIGLLTRSYMY